MNQDIKKIAENFSRHSFEITFPFIADNIQWNMMGGELIEGMKMLLRPANNQRHI